MTTYVRLKEIQPEIQTEPNWFWSKLCLTIGLIVYIMLLIIYMCLIENPPKFVYILLGITILGNNLIATGSLVNICQKKQSLDNWLQVYGTSFIFVNAINVGLWGYIYDFSISHSDKVIYFGMLGFMLPGLVCSIFVFSILLFIPLFCIIPRGCKNWIEDVKYCINERINYSSV